MKSHDKRCETGRTENLGPLRPSITREVKGLFYSKLRWFERSKNQSSLHGTKTRADTEAMVVLSSGLWKAIGEGGHTAKQGINPAGTNNALYIHFTDEKKKKTQSLQR